MEFWHCKRLLLAPNFSLCVIYPLVQCLYLKSHWCQILPFHKWQMSMLSEDFRHCQLAHYCLFFCSKPTVTLHPLSLQPRYWIPWLAYLLFSPNLLPLLKVSLGNQTQISRVGSAQNVRGLHSINICCWMKKQSLSLILVNYVSINETKNQTSFVNHILLLIGTELQSFKTHKSSSYITWQLSHALHFCVHSYSCVLKFI